MRSLNEFLDSLPRTRLGQLGREVPTYRALGIVGFYGALGVTLAGGLLTGRSLLLLAILALVSAASFFVYAYVRRWIAGQESLVFLEHVWFALAACAVVLWRLRESIAGYLDIVSVGMCVFLAAGRAGCTLVGCCYGRPASVGIVYGEACAQEGFPLDLVGLRLLPVAAMEMIGLLAIGAAGMFALPYARPGAVLAWFLAAYAILRFGLEGLRGDPRPHFLGLSQTRWMALAEVAAVLWWSDGLLLHGLRIEVAGGLAAVLLAGLMLRRAFGWRRLILEKPHLAELRAAVTTDLPRHPLVLLTSRGVRIAASSTGAAFGAEAHVSMSLPPDRRDLQLLCELGARAFPDFSPHAAYASGGTVLHLLIPIPLSPAEADGSTLANRGRVLYGAVLRRMQQGNRLPPASWSGEFTSPNGGVKPPLHRIVLPADVGPEPLDSRRPWYFTV